MKLGTLKFKIVSVGLTIGLIHNAAQAAIVSFDPSAPTGNFGNPTTSDNTIAYETSVTSTATTVDFKVTSDGVAANNFANIYISTGVKNGQPGSTVGFEVANNNVFIPGGTGLGGSGAGGTGPVPLAPGDGVVETISTTPTSTVIDLLVPWAYFMNDPENLGFDKITAANNEVRFNLSQSFGLSVAGDSNGSGVNYGADELGSAEFSAVPEPSTVIAGALLLLPFGFGAIRSLRKQRATA